MRRDKLTSLQGRREQAMATKIVVAMVMFVCLAAAHSLARASGPDYPDGHIGTLELVQIFDLAHLVDCRSRLEYDVLHMKNAVHVPVATMVREDLDRLRRKDPAKAIVFYCNGDECSQSLVAFEKASEWGYENIFVYRPGVFAWAQEWPEKVLFFGEIPGPADQDRLFARDHYLASCLPVSDFVVASRQAGTLVVDIRDLAGRQNVTISLPNLKHYPLDSLVKLVKSGSRKVTGKKMLILDSCGMQTRWLQYVLDNHGIDYAFLKGGVAAWIQAGLDRGANLQHGEVR